MNYSATSTSIVKEIFTFKTTPIEMAENLEWKKLKPIFLKVPFMARRRVFHRLHPIETANSIAKANIKDGETKSDDTRNVLNIITQKLVKKRCKVEEKSINPHDGQQQQAIEVNCEGLKSIFMEHDVGMSTDTVATDARVKSEQGFILSHLKAPANTESSDDCEPANKQSGNKPLISEDIFNELFASPSVAAPRDNPLDQGIFPQTPSLSRSSKKINKKIPHLNTTRFFE